MITEKQIILVTMHLLLLERANQAQSRYVDSVYYSNRRPLAPAATHYRQVAERALMQQPLKEETALLDLWAFVVQTYGFKANKADYFKPMKRVK